MFMEESSCPYFSLLLKSSRIHSRSIAPFSTVAMLYLCFQILCLQSYRNKVCDKNKQTSKKTFVSFCWEFLLLQEVDHPPRFSHCELLCHWHWGPCSNCPGQFIKIRAVFCSKCLCKTWFERHWFGWQGSFARASRAAKATRSLSESGAACSAVQEVWFGTEAVWSQSGLIHAQLTGEC